MKYLYGKNTPVLCRSWYDLVWAFPGLDKKLAKRMLPAAQTASTDEQVDAVAALATRNSITALSDTGSGVIPEVTEPLLEGVSSPAGQHDRGVMCLLLLTYADLSTAALQSLSFSGVGDPASQQGGFAVQ